MAQVGRVSFWIRSRIAKAKHEVGNQLRRLERKFGCFLPFEISAVREDELIKRLCRDFSEDAVSGSLVIGADVKRPPTRAAMFGSLQGKGSTKLYCVGIDSTSDCTGAEPAQRETGAPNSQVINVAGGTSLASVAQTVSALRDAHGIVGFDRVLIDCHVMQDKLGSQPVDISALGRAEIVYVYGTSTVFGARLQSQLLESADYQSVVIEPVRGSGHSIFRRTFRPRPTAATSPGGVFAKQAAYAPGNP